jgi:hypothetical protein
MRKVQIALFSILTVLLTAVVAQPIQAAPSYGCNNFNSQLCAPISVVSFESDVASSPISTGGEAKAYASTSTSKITFTIDADIANAGKTATLQFFDISAGIKFLVRSNQESACAAGSTIQKECVITLDSNGEASLYVNTINVTAGMQFQYKFVGPEAWTSGTVRTIFTTTGAAPVAPQACVANQSQVCGLISNVSFSDDGGQIATTTPDASGNAKATLAKASDLLLFSYRSESAYAFKYIYVDFHNISSGLTLQVDTSLSSTGAGCDRTVASAKGCYMLLDSDGSADFYVTLSGSELNRSFNYKLNGAGYTSKLVTVTIANKSVFAKAPAAGAPKLTVVAGGVQLDVKNAKGKKVSLIVNGKTLMSARASGNALSYVVPLSRGSHKVSVKIDSKTFNFKPKV